MEVDSVINIDELYIVNYCHPNCVPLKNIVRLPMKEAFLFADEMAVKNTGTAFGRFADFQNYYPVRMKVDKFLYESFISLGGKPKEEHPLSFVLQGSEFLHKWFDKGTINKILLKNISFEHISFTYGDSGAALERNRKISLFTKEMLLNLICDYKGTIDEYMDEITKNHRYIEAQLWSDDYCVDCHQSLPSSSSPSI